MLFPSLLLCLVNTENPIVIMMATNNAKIVILYETNIKNIKYTNETTRLDTNWIRFVYAVPVLIVPRLSTLIHTAWG